MSPTASAGAPNMPSGSVSRSTMDPWSGRAGSPESAAIIPVVIDGVARPRASAIAADRLEAQGLGVAGHGRHVAGASPGRVHAGQEHTEVRGGHLPVPLDCVGSDL
jgi:hypothetical protein